jgi:hypothetical protein
VTIVQVKQVNPIVVTVKGQEISLPNRLYFEVLPVDPDALDEHTLPYAVLGELRRLRPPVSLRQMQSEDSQSLLDNLQVAIASDQDSASPVTSSLPNGDTVFSDKTDRLDSASSSEPIVENKIDHALTQPSPEEKARFQGLLSRLQKNADQLPQPCQAANLPNSLGQINDPAIVAIKVKQRVGTTEKSSDGETQNAGSSRVSKPQPIHVRMTAHELFAMLARSSTSDDARSSSISQRAKEPSTATDDSQTKRLNPAAAEFKSTKGGDVPWFTPKKMSRTPLTNIFPDAISNHDSLEPSPLVGTALVPELNQQQTVGRVDAGPTPSSLASLEAQLAASQTVLSPPGLNIAATGGYPGSLPPTNPIIRPIITPLPLHATLSAATTSSSPAFTNYGTYPSATISNAPISVPHLSLPTAPSLGMNTFPFVPVTPAMTMSGVCQSTTASSNPWIAPLGAGQTSQPLHLQQQDQNQQPQPQLGLGLGGNTGSKPALARPYFPVTQKPRDHDPVKQQLYEAYLEWRKANEPGYHLKCKMRQAHRVVRQFQKQQQQQHQAQEPKHEQGKPAGSHDRSGQTPDPGSNRESNNTNDNSAASWKEIAERAKAAVGMAAAAAAAEKNARLEKVREELRAKVRRKCVALAVQSSDSDGSADGAASAGAGKVE